MAEQVTYSLWFRPFGEVGFELRQQIKELSRQYDSPMFYPHVTLLGGLDMHETKLVQLTDTLAHSLAPFTVYLNKAAAGNTYFQSLFVRIQKTEPLLGAHNIAKELFDCEGQEEYYPHLSLMYGKQQKKEKQKLLNVMGRSFNMQFDVHSVLLIKTGDQVHEWEKIHHSEFTKHHREDEF